MTFLNFTPGNLQWLGIAVEATPGTAAAAPTVWIPVASPKLVPHIGSMPDNALRGSMAKDFGNLLAGRYDEMSYSTYLYADSCFLHFLAILGTADALSGSSDPWTHKTSLKNSGNGQPATHTLFYADGTGQAFTIAGAQLSQLKVSVKVDGLVQLDANWMGLPSTVAAAPTNTPTALPPAPGWNSTITLGGTAMTKYSEIDVTYTRANEAKFTVNGTQAPSAIYCGELDVAFDLTGVYQGSTSDTDWTNFLANTQPSLVLKMAAAGDAIHALTLQHSKVAYQDVSFEGSNKYLEIKSKAIGIANATDALGGGVSPALATLTSAQSTAFV
jgi:hypothetical protein